MHIRINSDLEGRVHEYVERHHTTITEVVTKLLQDLLAAEEAKLLVPEAEQV